MRHSVPGRWQESWSAERPLVLIGILVGVYFVVRSNFRSALIVTRDGERVASKVRFDLDLPSAAEDDVVLGDGIPLPEWDYRKNLLLEDHVRLAELTPSLHDPRAAPCALPEHLRRTARRLHRQFAALTPGRRWLKAQVDGTELDLDAVVRAATDRATGHHPSDQLYLSLEKRERDLACLALADLSLSTDSWVSSEARVIDGCLTCPWHGFRFDCLSGECLTAPQVQLAAGCSSARCRRASRPSPAPARRSGTCGAAPCAGSGSGRRPRRSEWALGWRSWRTFSAGASRTRTRSSSSSPRNGW